MKTIQGLLDARRLRWTALVAGVAAANFLAGSMAEAVILYRETFGTATTGGQGAPQGYDWAAHSGATAVNQSANTANIQPSINRNANVSKPGASDTIGQVNAGPVIGAVPAAYGTGIPFSPPGVGNTIFWTPEYPTLTNTAGINPAMHPGLKFSWYQGNGNTDGSWHIVIRQANQWYATQQTFVNTAAVTSIVNFGMGDDDGNGGTAHGAELKSFTYTSDAGAWLSLNFDGTFTLGPEPGMGGMGTSGTVLSLGSQPGSNLTGVIDHFGLFSDVPGASGNRRFDTFTISDLTEPPSNAGDYNNNGQVDAADYVMWRENVGQPKGTLPNDSSPDDPIGTSQYTQWKANFGNAAGSGAALGAALVPEPVSVILLVLGLAGLSLRRR